MLNALVRHDDDLGGRPEAGGVDDAQRHQVLREGRQVLDGEVCDLGVLDESLRRRLGGGVVCDVPGPIRDLVAKKLPIDGWLGRRPPNQLYGSRACIVSRCDGRLSAWNCEVRNLLISETPWGLFPKACSVIGDINSGQMGSLSLQELYESRSQWVIGSLGCSQKVRKCLQGVRFAT